MPAHILILEDQPDAVALLARAVRASFGDVHLALAHDLATVRKITAPELQRHFDYALVDMRLPDGLSIEWLREFKLQQPTTVAIVTSLYDDDDLVFAALRAGADGYLLKGDGADHLEHALARLLQGEPPISPAIARKLMQQFRAPAGFAEVAVLTEPRSTADVPQTTSRTASSSKIQALSAREEDVLAAIGSGLMIKQVAAKLGISYHTVNDNIKAIYRKLGIHTRAQAASEASRLGLMGSHGR